VFKFNTYLTSLEYANISFAVFQFNYRLVGLWGTLNREYTSLVWLGDVKQGVDQLSLAGGR
jgi:hypothetical protein